MVEKQEVINYIISELKNYRLYKDTLAVIINESVGIQANIITDMPHSVTNKFSSVTESNALFNKDIEALQRDIQRIEKWLNHLIKLQHHVIYNFYVNKCTYNTITEEWYKLHNTIYSERFWKYKRKTGLNNIYLLLLNALKNHVSVKNPLE